MATRHADFTSTQVLRQRHARLALRRIWLPTLIYESLPYFYIAAGFIALFATLYISEWYWIVPSYLLFAAFCLHLGFLVWRRRRRERLRP